jgi:HEAT repeat protein
MPTPRPADPGPGPGFGSPGMTALLAIWWVSCGLAAVSLIAMGGLIVHRARRNRRDRLDADRREELKKLAWELMDRPDRLFLLKSQIQANDRRLLIQLFSELLQKIRGKYAERFVSLMRILGLMEECLQRLNDRSWWVRAEACTVLGAFNDANVKLALYRALEDPIMEVRVEAARSLVRLDAVRSVAELVGQLVTDEAMPSLAVVDLFRNLSRSAVPEFLDMLEVSPKAAVKLVAIDALGHSGDLDTVPALLHYYDHPSQLIRLAAMQAFSLLRDPRALAAVLLAMTDFDWEVRAQAATAAGQIGASEALPLLERLLEDEHWWVRYHAAEAMHSIGDLGIVALNEIATRPNPVAAEMAWGILREKGLAA